MPLCLGPVVRKRVLRLRVKDKHAAWLSELARDTNVVWNFCNELSGKVFDRERRFLTGFDFWPYLKGATKCGLSIPVQTVQEVAEEYARRRRDARKVRLRWRKSMGARRSLGWLPFKVRTLRCRGGQVWFAGRAIGVWDSFGLAEFAPHFRAGSFAEDARGRWYLNICIELPELNGPMLPRPSAPIGIDLGLKALYATSAGTVEQARRFYRDLEPKLAIAQRAGKTKRLKALHAKISNRRKDFLHKQSTAIVRKHGAVFVGNVNAVAQARSGRGKSVLDAAWSSFRTMLKYKCDDAAAAFAEVDESYSTQDCSACGARTGPKGRDELHVRAWRCSVCEQEHDRDVNSARNILVRGLSESRSKQAVAVEPRGAEAVVNEGAARQHPRSGMAVR
jgi:putative transposase